MNNNGNDTIFKRCASRIQANGIFLIESILIFSLAFVAVFVISVEIKILYKSGGATPINIKLLFLNALIASLLRSIRFTLSFLYYFLIFWDPTTVVPCGLPLCILLQYFYVVPAIVDYYLFFFIAVERIWTTFHLEPTSISSKPWIYSLICIFFSWSFNSFGFFYFMIGKKVFDTPPKTVCYCYINVLWPNQALFGNIVVLLILHLFTCCAYAFTYFENKTILSEFGVNRARQTLSTRFTIWSNIRTMKWLAPVTLVNASISSVVLTMIFLGRKIFADGFSPIYLCYIQLCYLIICSQDVMVPILTLRFNISQQNTARELFPSIFNAPLVKKLLSMDNDQNEIHVLPHQTGVVGSKTAPPARSLAAASLVLAATGGDLKSAEPKKRSDRETAMVGQTEKTVRPNLPNGRRKIFDYRIHPEEYHDILNDMWRKP